MCKFHKSFKQTQLERFDVDDKGNYIVYVHYFICQVRQLIYEKENSASLEDVTLNSNQLLSI